MLIYNRRVETINTMEAHSDWGMLMWALKDKVLSRMMLMLLTWWGGEKYGPGSG